MSSTTTLLFVKGEQSQFDQFTKVADKANMHYHTVKNFADAVKYIAEKRPSFVLMDLNLGGRDATDLIGEMDAMGHKERCVTVVFSDRKENYVEVTALNAGADDFLVKPVNKRVFAARLATWVRHQRVMTDAFYEDSTQRDFALDNERYAMVINKEEISLQRKEFEILSLLVSRPRKVFSRKEIRQSVWGSVDKGKNRTIDVHIRNLRSKIGQDYIKTYKGVGYSFDR